MISTLLIFYIPFYILSIIFCYFVTRKWYIKNDLIPGYLEILLVFCPFYNLIAGIIAIIDNLNLDINKDYICKKFFRLK